MKEFKKISRSCLYRDGSFCSYWGNETQCHFLSCPLFSRELTETDRLTLKKRIIDSVQFSVEDFEKTSITILDLIDKIRNSDLEQPVMENYPRSSIVVDKQVQRMICFVCGEIIDDDKYSTVRDPNGVILYFHSKGECIPRITNINGVREKWLKTHLSKD